MALVENDFGLIMLKTRLSGGVVSFRERIEPKVDAVIRYLLTEYHSDEFRWSLVLFNVSSLILCDLQTTFERFNCVMQCGIVRKIRNQTST